MPLHLLGKKSWNVYNADNIARVRRDEAAAKAAEEAEEQRMQEIDAQRRLAILRGEVPPPIEDARSTTTEDALGSSRDATYPGAGSLRRKHKRPGEDDTDFEVRIAKERDQVAVSFREPERKATSSAPIVDQNGHIDLFGDERERAHAEKNDEAEAENKKKKQSYEDQYTMRFSNAAGKDGLKRPWYSEAEAMAASPAMKDVWGNEDPRRKERDAQRIVANDPLAMMKKGASKVRELNKERKRFQEERDEELRQLRREERHREKKKRRHEEGEREHGSSSRREDRRRRSRSRDRNHRERDDDSKTRRDRRRGGDELRRRRDSTSPDHRGRDRQRRSHHRND